MRAGHVAMVSGYLVVPVVVAMVWVVVGVHASSPSTSASASEVLAAPPSSRVMLLLLLLSGQCGGLLLLGDALVFGLLPLPLHLQLSLSLLGHLRADRVELPRSLVHLHIHRHTEGERAYTSVSMDVCVWGGGYLAVAHLPQSERTEELPHLDAVSRLRWRGVEGEHIQQLRRAQLVGLPTAAALFLALLPAPLPLRLLLPVLAQPKDTHTHTHTHTERERESGDAVGGRCVACEYRMSSLPSPSYESGRQGGGGRGAFLSADAHDDDDFCCQLVWRIQDLGTEGGAHVCVCVCMYITAS